MTKHDPAEIEAVSSAIGDVTNRLIASGQVTIIMTTETPYFEFQKLGAAAISALDAHRAPKVREAVDELVESIDAYHTNGGDDRVISLRYRELLAICGITNEQENA